MSVLSLHSIKTLFPHTINIVSVLDVCDEKSAILDYALEEGRTTDDTSKSDSVENAKLENNLSIDEANAKNVDDCSIAYLDKEESFVAHIQGELIAVI